MVERATDIGYDDPDDILPETVIPEPEALTVPEVPEAEDETALVIPEAPKRPKVIRASDKPKEEPIVDVGEGVDDPDAIMPEEPKAEPAGEGGYIGESAKGAAAGATETVGGMLKGGGAIRVEDMQRRLEEAARAKVMEEMGLGGAGQVTQITPEIRKRLEEATKSVEQLDLANDPFFKAGLATTEWSEKNFAAAKGWEDSWTRQFSSGLGSIAPYVVLSAVTPAGGAAIGTAIGTAAGYAGSTGEAVDRAIQAGVSREDLMETIRYAGIPGLTEQVAVDELLSKIPLPVVGKFMGVIGRLASKAMVEGGQEAVTQVMQNVIAKYVYKPDQSLSEGVAEAAAVGAAVGAVVGAPGAIAGPPKEDEDDEETIDEAGETKPEAGVALPDPEAVQNPPGGLGEPPTPPANAGAPTVVTTPEPVVTTPKTGDADVDAALAPAAPKGRGKKAPAVVTPLPEPEEDEDISSEIAGDITAATGEQLAATEARLRGMFEDENKTQAAAAQQTKAAVPNADIAAALDAAKPKPPMAETLGTGKAVGGTIPAPAPAPVAQQPVPGPPLAQGPGVAPSSPVPAGRRRRPPLQPPTPEAVAADIRSRLEPEEQAKLDTLRAEEPVAAFQPAAAPVLQPEEPTTPAAEVIAEAPAPRRCPSRHVSATPTSVRKRTRWRRPRTGCAS